MPNTLSIALLESQGACKPHCIALREIYPSGTIVFDMAFYQQMRDKKVNVFWATPLLPPAVQAELALSWFDRALDKQGPSWKAALRALLAKTEADAATLQLGQRLTERRDVDEKDALATAIAGVGYAAAALAIKFAEEPRDAARILSGMVVMAQWCAQCASLVEAVEMDVVLDELQSSVFKALETHGATL